MEKEHYDIYTTHDADDFSQPTRFEEIINIFNSSNSILNVQDLELRIGNNPPEWYNTPFTPMINIAHGFFSKKAFELFGYFDDTDYSGDEDYWRRVIRYCESNPYTWKTLEKVLYYAEVTDDNMILRYDDDLRKIYRQKFFADIELMSKSNNFYRNFFEK